MRVPIALLLTTLLSTLSVVASGDPPIPQSERDALEAIFSAAGGPHWLHRDGWGGERGTECSWYGVQCWPNFHAEDHGLHVTSLMLQENNLVGVIPNEAAALTDLNSAWLWKNKLVRVPTKWQELDDRGELDLRLSENPIEHRITEISLEQAQGSLLCAHSIVKLRADGPSFSASIRCRNRTRNDRATFCEVKEVSHFYGFERLARFVERSGFHNLKRSYTVNQTHAGSAITRVTKDGEQRTVDDYGYMQPLELYGIEMAIAGVAAEMWWQKTTRYPEKHCWDLFEAGNDTIHAGITYVIEIPPDVKVGESEYLKASRPEDVVERAEATDKNGLLLTIDAMVARRAGVIAENDVWDQVTINGRRAYEHRGSTGSSLWREVLFPVHGVVTEEGYVRIFYQNLSRERAAKADAIISTLEEKHW